MTTNKHVLPAARAFARQQIDTDKRGRPAAMQRHLETLYEHLFDPDFDAAEVAAEPAAQRQFRFTFGVSPKSYRDQLLFKIARQLVCHTKTPITEIGAGLGFPEPEAFSRWFKYRAGLSPMKLREEHRPPRPPQEPPREPPRPPEDDDGFPQSPREWRRLILGLASREKAVAFIRWLHRAYPEALAGKAPPTE